MSAPLRLEPHLIAALRADLGALPSAHELLGMEAAEALAREARVPALLATAVPRSTADAEAGRICARLFLAGEPVSPVEVDRALPTLGAAGALRLGVVTPTAQGLLAPAVDLRPVGEMWFAADLGERHTGRAVAADHVPSVGGASLTLASLTVRHPVGRALDLGTGCGIQAATLAAHAGEVVATDLSERALAYAAFNAALNGQSWDLRRGSLLAPVAGESFDLVVSNPPFVVTPATVRDAGLPALTYRDGGRSGDDLLASLVRELPAHLTPGGVAHLLGNWEHRRGEDWRDRVASWAAGTGVDLWVVQRDFLDPAQYVEMWLRDGGLTERRAHEAAYAAWLQDFHEREVEGVGFGYLVLRRPAEPREPWVRLEEITGPVAEPLGDHIAATLAAVEWLARTPDGALAATHLHTAPDVTIEHHYRPGEADPAVILVRQGGGFRRAIALDTATAGLLGACDGELRVDQIVRALAALLDVPHAELSAALLGSVRNLVIDGLLVHP